MVDPRKHDAVEVNYKGTMIPVDRSIVGLITKIWALGIDTGASCEGQQLASHDMPKVFVSFVDYDAFNRFMRLMILGEDLDERCLDKPIYSIILFGGGYEVDSWQACLHNIKGVWDVPYGGVLSFSVGLYFPMRDLPWVEQMLDVALADGASQHV